MRGEHQLENESDGVDDFLKGLGLNVVHGDLTDIALDVSLIEPKSPKFEKSEEDVLSVASQHVIGNN